MASKKVIEYSSALPMSTKITTLTQEILRINRNTSRREGAQVRIAMINKFMNKMSISGYPESVRLNVLESGTKGYYNMVMKEVNGEGRVNRAASEGHRLRIINKLTGKCIWFKPKYTIQNDEINILED